MEQLRVHASPEHGVILYGLAPDKGYWMAHYHQSVVLMTNSRAFAGREPAYVLVNRESIAVYLEERGADTKDVAHIRGDLPFPESPRFDQVIPQKPTRIDPAATLYDGEVSMPVTMCSAAGWYVGTVYYDADLGGWLPNSRDTGYYPSRDEPDEIVRQITRRPDF